MRNVWAMLLLALLLVTTVVTPVMAWENRTGMIPRITANEVIHDDLLLTGESATIDGTVNGDVFAAVNTLFVNGTINGNLFVAANTVEITGTVTGTVISLGQRVLVNGEIGRNLVAAGERVLLGPDSAIKQSFMGAADYLEHLGAIGRGSAMAAGRIQITGTIGQELQAAVGRLEIASTSRIQGPVTYWSDFEAKIASEAKTGAVTHRERIGNWRLRYEGKPWFFGPWQIVFKFVGFVLVGLVFLALFPRLRHIYPQRLFAKPWQAPLAGALSLITLPIGAILISLTVIGIPLGILTLISLPLLVYTSQILASWTVGHFLATQVESFKDLHWTVLFLLGAVATTALVQIPIVGHLVAWALVFYGLGGMYFTIVQREA